jgi:S-adenosylmethionine hydrolase
MADRIITLTTDFGTSSPYVAALKGVILSLNPAARLVDLSHQIPPQNVVHAAFLLAAAVAYFPPRTIHVIVVDPGVGSGRPLLLIEVGGQLLLAPDNGCWTMLADRFEGVPTVIRLEEPRFWRDRVSATFHGRDILAPVAGHLSLGTSPRELGPQVKEWVRLPMPLPKKSKNYWFGQVVFIDDFGNLITNIGVERLKQQGFGEHKGIDAPAFLSGGLRVGAHDLRHCPWVSYYAQASPGQLVVLASSMGFLEVAVVQGNAAQRLKAKVGTPVRVSGNTD